MYEFTFLDVVLIAGLSQGIFLALSLRLLKERNKQANAVLVWILSISVLMLLGKLSLFRFKVEWIWYVALFVDSVIFLIGPLIYMYVRRLTFQENPAFTVSWPHYIPTIIHVIYFFWYFSLSRETLQEWHQTGRINYFYFGFELLGLLSFAYYWIISAGVFKKFNRLKTDEFSNPQQVSKFLKVFLGSLGLCLLFWVFSFLNSNFFFYDIPYLSYLSLWISIPVFIYAVGYYSLRQPEIFRIPLPKPKEVRARLKPEEIQQLKKRLQYFMHEESVFLDPAITLKTLSEKLHTTPNNLSWFLNNVYHSSFSDYINKMRIERFLEKVANGEHLKKTLLALAMEVGFNSKSNFNKVFKAQKGEPPSSYIKKKSVA
ncbi:AraC family transcriptional regulator [Aureisphaera galaxeae]|uniref:helix-turn-helix domain-containing protein n=1 Tax=Aureisphaera galaxeae TaxID=1538023 RepID=UPI002350EF12|nr:AraC family transcriptional regulator [Aureisphaera galaxeae]MDC8006020.1 AraC family transcriptional regulator [Aureisphaera galaxeae]